MDVAAAANLVRLRNWPPECNIVGNNVRPTTLMALLGGLLISCVCANCKSFSNGSLVAHSSTAEQKANQHTLDRYQSVRQSVKLMVEQSVSWLLSPGCCVFSGEWVSEWVKAATCQSNTQLSWLGIKFTQLTTQVLWYHKKSPTIDDHFYYCPTTVSPTICPS